MSNQVKMVVAFRTGGPYTVRDVDALWRNVKRFHPDMEFVVYSDHPDTYKYCDRCELLVADWSDGWWSVIECLREVGSVFFTGLDTIMIKPITPLIDAITTLQSDEFIMMSPFNPRQRELGKMASGVMGWNGDVSFLYDEFNPAKIKAKISMEQDYTYDMLVRYNYKVLDGREILPSIGSYKRHYAGTLAYGREKRPVDGLGLILFHGNPRPSMIDDEYLLSFRK